MFSTHVLHQAELLCDRIFLIDRGVKLLDDNLSAIRERFRQRIVSVEIVGTCSLPSIPGTRAEHVADQPGRIDLHLDEHCDERTVMRATLDAVDVRSISRREPTLEEIFTSLVTEDATI